jgi:UDPglucose--hexose-1-phosphate uridylyltransferase
MSEYRQDAHSGGWVLVAPERGNRPGKRGWCHAHADAGRPETPCPFCAGHEHLLPDIIEQMPSSNPPGWLTRVVPNKFPALAVDASGRPEAGFGRHEVIVETARHDADLGNFSDAELDAVLRTYRARYVALAALPRTRHVVLFRNRGRRAGASLSHPHAQIVAMDRLPPRLKRIAASARDHHRRYGRCATCREVEDLLAHRQRLVRETPRFVLAVPYAAAGPFELVVVPRRHAASFGDVDDQELQELGHLLRWAVGRLDALLDAPPYNLTLESIEPEGRNAAALHWRISIVPRLTNRGGFELATDLAINPSSPEHDAGLLRDEAS